MAFERAVPRRNRQLYNLIRIYFIKMAKNTNDFYLRFSLPSSIWKEKKKWEKNTMIDMEFDPDGFVFRLRTSPSGFPLKIPGSKNAHIANLLINTKCFSEKTREVLYKNFVQMQEISNYEITKESILIPCESVKKQSHVLA